jgi:hypothetical protein
MRECAVTYARRLVFQFNLRTSRERRPRSFAIQKEITPTPGKTGPATLANHSCDVADLIISRTRIERVGKARIYIKLRTRATATRRK